MARKADHHARTPYCEHVGTMESSSLLPSNVRDFDGYGGNSQFV